MEKLNRFTFLHRFRLLHGVVLGAVLVIASPAAHAQEGDEDWEKVTSIEIDLSIYELFEEVTAIVVSCQLDSTSPSGVGGEGYAVIYNEAGFEGDDISNRAYDDTWIERINFIRKSYMVDDGGDYIFEVDIYADDVDYRFWNKGSCNLRLFNRTVSEASSNDLIGHSKPPTKCSALSGGQFYEAAWRCSPDVVALESWEFTFVREDADDE